MSDTILVINAGSSSIKFSAFGAADEPLDLLVKDQIEGIGTAPRFAAWDNAGTVLAKSEWEPVVPTIEDMRMHSTSSAAGCRSISMGPICWQSVTGWFTAALISLHRC